MSNQQRIAVLCQSNPNGAYLAGRLAVLQKVDAFTTISGAGPTHVQLDNGRVVNVSDNLALRQWSVLQSAGGEKHHHALVVVCVDSQDTEACLALVRDRFVNCQVLVSLQCGLDNSKLISASFLHAPDTGEKTETKDVDERPRDPPQMLVGCLGIEARVIHSNDLTVLVPAYFGAIYMERLSKQKADLGSILGVIEQTNLRVVYYYSKQVRNVMWGDVVWRSCNNVVQFAATAMQGTNKCVGFYQLLEQSPQLRLLYCDVIDEAYHALQFDRVDHIQTATSPFQLHLKTVRWLLRMPTPVYRVLLTVWQRVRINKDAHALNNVPFLQPLDRVVSTVPASNRHVVDMALGRGLSVPLNELVANTTKDAELSVDSFVPKTTAIAPWMLYAIAAVLLCAVAYLLV